MAAITQRKPEMLDVEGVVWGLLERGLIEESWIIGGELTIRSVAQFETVTCGSTVLAGSGT